MAKKKSPLQLLGDIATKYYVVIAGFFSVAFSAGYIVGTTEKNVEISDKNTQIAQMIAEFGLKEADYKTRITKLESRIDSLNICNNYGK